MQLNSEPRKLTNVMLERANLPELYWDVAFKNVPQEAKYRPMIQRYVKNIIEVGGEGMGLFLWSIKNGTGKTSLAALVMRQFLKHGASGYYCRCDELMDDVIKNKMFDEFTTVRDWVRTCDVLVLDDVGKEHKGASGYAENLIESVIRDRVQRKRATLISTNLSPDQIPKMYSKDLADVMKEAFYIVNVLGVEGGGRYWREDRKNKLQALMGAA